MISIRKKKHLLSQWKGGVSMEVIKFLLNNSDAIIVSVVGAFIYDKLKITLTGHKSDSVKK